MQGLFLLFATSALAQCLGNYPLQLAVDTAELVGGPLFESLPRVAVNTQHKTFCGIFLWHKFSSNVQRLTSFFQLVISKYFPILLFLLFLPFLPLGIFFITREFREFGEFRERGNNFQFSIFNSQF